MTDYFLATPHVRGEISKEQADRFDAESLTFACGKCSDDSAQVFHNVSGQHMHVPAARLRDQATRATAQTESQSK